MADTIADIEVSNTVYSDISVLSGIVAGTALVISNKGICGVRLQIAATIPDADSKDGEILYHGPHPTNTKLITAGENKVWAQALAFNDTPLSVQDNT